MKKLLSIFVFALTSSMFAQTSVLATMSGTGDTLKNATTKSVIQQVNNTYKYVSIQAVFTKVSGTVAGSGKLYGSVDGVNYQLITQSTDTLAMSDVATNTKVWVLTNANYLYYKVTYTGADTTMIGIVKGYLYGSNQISKHVSVNMLSDINAVSDTITNTGTGYVGYRVKNAYNTVTIQAVVTRLSGTAAGTVTLQGSNDGINYVTVSASYSDAQTLSVSNVATQSKLFVVTGSPYAYYRLSYAGSGTMSCTLKGYLLANR